MPALEMTTILPLTTLQHFWAPASSSRGDSGRMRTATTMLLPLPASIPVAAVAAPPPAAVAPSIARRSTDTETVGCCVGETVGDVVGACDGLEVGALDGAAEVARVSIHRRSRPTLRWPLLLDDDWMMVHGGIEFQIRIDRSGPHQHTRARSIRP